MEPGILQLNCKGKWRRWQLQVAVLALLAWPFSACIQTGIPPIGGTPAQRLAEAEQLYADARDLFFQAGVVEAMGSEGSDRGASLEQLRGAWRALSERAAERLGALDSSRYGDEDRRAIRVMRETLRSSQEATEQIPAVPCQYDATSLGKEGADALVSAMHACFGARAAKVVAGVDTLDRLSILTRLTTEPDSIRRRTLFMALSPLWQAVNGNNEQTSPWRTLVALRSPEWKRGYSPIQQSFASLGMDPTKAESTLVSMLNAWQRHVPPGLIEPWDWFFEIGTAGRRLSSQIPRERLLTISEDFFSSFGANPRLFGVVFDIDAREGKTPVAYTQFGGISRRTAGGPAGANPHVFATYREGGLGNLVELLHETAHALHIAAIEIRPAFADWPDSDPFTEGLADVIALEAYEPAWQQKYLGDSASTVASIREKYGAVMMDVAWALFELRMYDSPESDPNDVWSDITSRFLGIAPHPELSWWAMRGQLIESPGYMANYALGAILAADVRARIRERWGGLTRSDARLYDRLAQDLYRFGRSRPARQVLESFLGRPLSMEPLFRDLRR